MIGDSDVDVLTARRVGARAIGCLFGLAPHSLDRVPAGSAGAASVRVARGAGALALPGSEQAPQQNELADVIGVVIGDEQRLAKQILVRRPTEMVDEIDIVHRVHEALKGSRDLRESARRSSATRRRSAAPDLSANSRQAT